MPRVGLGAAVPFLVSTLKVWPGTAFMRTGGPLHALIILSLHCSHVVASHGIYALTLHLLPSPHVIILHGFPPRVSPLPHSYIPSQFS